MYYTRVFNDVVMRTFDFVVIDAYWISKHLVHVLLSGRAFCDGEQKLSVWVCVGIQFVMKLNINRKKKIANL